MTENRSRPFVMPLIAVVTLVGFGVGGYFVWRHERRVPNEVAASTALKTLQSAESVFRMGDRDANQIQDYWTGDVAGLYYVKANGQSIQLIDRSLAEADASPLQVLCYPPRPFRGYLFVAMDADDTELDAKLKVYRQDTGGEPAMGAVHNFSRFGFCAYPAEYGVTGKYTFIGNEIGPILRFDSKGKPLLRWPTDKQLGELLQ